MRVLCRNEGFSTTSVEMKQKTYILHEPEATAAADPPDEPPADLSSVLPEGLEGLMTGPKAECTLADLQKCQIVLQVISRISPDRKSVV